MPHHGFCDGPKLYLVHMVLNKAKPLNMTCVQTSAGHVCFSVDLDEIAANFLRACIYIALLM